MNASTVARIPAAANIAAASSFPPPRRCDSGSPYRRTRNPGPPPGRGFVCLEPQRLDLDDVEQGAHRLEQRRRQLLVDAGEEDRVLPRCGAAEMEGSDIDLGGGEGLAERADEPGLVVVAHIQHVPAELGFERNAGDRDQARLVAGEQGALDRPALA